MIENADYIVAGGGSAGCVLANRLSEDHNVRVVLLEYGGTGDRLFVNIPAALLFVMNNPETNWLYPVEPDPSAAGRNTVWQAGKLLGGGSSINGMVYTRGARYDYDGWAAAGCAGWSWNDVLPYFLRAETFEGEPSQFHGQHGPQSVAPLRAIHPLAHAFMDACIETGMRRAGDGSNGDIEGVAPPLATQRRGKRSSTAESYLKQAEKRPNLTVLTGAMVDRVLIANGRASGVVYRKGGVERTIAAAREIIISAGTIQSPAILMRSGIGPAAHLKEHGIAVQVDLADVGKNLDEHVNIHISRLVNLPTYKVFDNPLRLLREALKYVLFRRGMLASCSIHAMAHTRSDPSLPNPDIKLMMSPTAISDASGRSTGKYGMNVSANTLCPKSRGEIRLRSANPSDTPIIDYKMFAATEDLVALRKGVRIIERVYASPALAKHVIGFNTPPRSLADSELEDYIRANGRPGAHPISTCRMGSDPSTSVVDLALRVRGVVGLRVIDASIMPTMPSANTNAPTIMIAEKGADMIKSTNSLR